MTSESVLMALDAQISARSILDHPFYRAWERGELTRPQLSTYATLYYPHVAAFPEYLSSAIAGTADPLIRRELEDNLRDELQRPKPHPELWLDFAEALGAAREQVRTAEPHPAAAATVAAFGRLARGETAGALAALYAYESQQPEVSAKKSDGLREMYGVTAPQGLAYFEVHRDADVEHREGELRAIGRCLDSGADPRAIRESAAAALDAYWGLLDGVCDEIGLNDQPRGREPRPEALKAAQ